MRENGSDSGQPGVSGTWDLGLQSALQRSASIQNIKSCVCIYIYMHIDLFSYSDIDIDMEIDIGIDIDTYILLEDQQPKAHRQHMGMRAMYLHILLIHVIHLFQDKSFFD